MVKYLLVIGGAIKTEFLNISENHPTFRLIPDLNELCKPLFQHTPVDMFAHSRLYPDEACISLSTYFKWKKFVYIDRGIDTNYLISYDAAKFYVNMQREKNLICFTNSILPPHLASIHKDFNPYSPDGNKKSTK